MRSDARRKVGTRVQAKASNVLNEAQCRRLYGSNWKTKLLSGIVVGSRDKNEGSTGPRKQKCWLITADYDLNGTIKRKELNVRSVMLPKDGPPSSGGDIRTNNTAGSTEMVEIGHNSVNIGGGDNDNVTGHHDQSTNQTPNIETNAVSTLQLNSNATATNTGGAEIGGSANTTNNNATTTSNIMPPPSEGTTITERSTRTTNSLSPSRFLSNLFGAATSLLSTTGAVNNNLQNDLQHEIQINFSTSEEEKEEPQLPPLDHTTDIICHGKVWTSVENNSLKVPAVKEVRFRQWYVVDQFGNRICPGSDWNGSRLDAFMLMFPPQQLTLMVREMNIQLRRKRKKEINSSELLKFFGVILLMTKVRFDNRRSLWSTTGRSRYLPAYNFGQTGITRHRFDELMQSLRWSHQPVNRPEEMSHSTWRWMLISDFVENFNRYRGTNFIPSDLICVDESMSKWNGLGGSWINIGLPTFVSMDRKPVDGCEIQDACCARSRIMLSLKLVGHDDNNELDGSALDREGLPHAVRVMDELLHPWKNDGERLVGGDSWFASVPAVRHLKLKGFRYVGPIKTATREYPMAHLQSLELQQRGDFRYMISSEGDEYMTAVMWADRDRKYFIGNGEATLVDVEPTYRTRWRQLDNVENNTDPQRIDIQVREPSMCKSYHFIANQIDCHNRQRQDDVELERIIKTKSWDKRVGMSIFGMILVDTCNFHQAVIHPDNIDANPFDFYLNLAEELIDNNLDNINTRSQSTSRRRPTSQPQNMMLRSPHLTPTRERKRKRDGSITRHTLQGHCRGHCGKKTTHLCSVCMIEKPTPKPWYCRDRDTGNSCFEDHCEECHNTTT